MPKIPIAALIAQNPADGDRINFLTWFYAQFDSSIAAHQTILNVEPLCYIGLIAATEFLTYANNKLYLVLSCEFGVTSGVSAVPPNIDFYDFADAVFFKKRNHDIAYSVADIFGNLPFIINNIYFSRITTVTYTYMNFNGYRVTLN